MEAKFIHSLSTKPPQPSPTFTLSNPSATTLNQIHTRLNHRRPLSLKINAISNNSDITEPENTNVDPQPEAVEVRFRRRSISRRSKQRMEGVEIDERLLKTPKETTKGMAADEGMDLLTMKSQLGETYGRWKQETERHQSQVDFLQDKLVEVKACIEGSEEDSNKELEVLWRRVKTTAILLKYLKSKARLMAIPQLAHTSCGIKQLEGVGLVDKNGTPLSGWCRNLDISCFDGPDEEISTEISELEGSLDDKDTAYVGEIIKSVQLVADVLELLVKRVLLAESETAMEKDKVNLGQDEIKRKSVQIENMSFKLEEMEKFALGTNTILNEMKQRVEDLVEETSRQRQRAAENEQELFRVKQDFVSLKSYVSSLITVRETLLSSEKQFKTIERLFERLVAKTTQIEGEKMQKEAEVQKLMEENVKLSALLDKKEAQLLAMNEQCKVMALSASDI